MSGGYIPQLMEGLMRRFVTGMAGFLASCGAGLAADPVVWEGTAYLTAIKEATAGACINNGWRVGQHALGVVQPKVVNGTLNDTFMLNFARPAAWFKVTGVSAASITKVDIRYIMGRAGFQIADAVTLTGSSITPALASITTSTPSVTLQLVVANWANNSGCTVTIRGTFAKRPV